MFKASFFTTNRRKLSKRVDGGLIIISANGLLQRTGDSVYPFRQDSNFFYLTGLNEPDFLLVMNGDEEFLVLPKRSFAEDIFGGVINCDEVAKISGINTILGNREGWQRIKEMQQSRKSVHTMTMPPRRVVHTDAFSTNPNRRYLTERLKRSSPATALVDLRPHLVSLRQVKQPEEITVMKEAIALTGRGLVTAKQQIRTGITGHELKATLDSVFGAAGAEHGFTPIVTSSEQTAVMHSLTYGKQVGKNAAVLFDVGAELKNYTADITRTYVNGQASERFVAVYAAVDRVKRHAEKLVRPGLGWGEWARQVDQAMGEELIRLRLIKTNHRIEVRRYFSHAIGHSLGLDAHDVCNYMLPIEAGMIITIEPGIYIPEEGFGVRIEDDYLVTASGVRNLSADIAYFSA